MAMNQDLINILDTSGAHETGCRVDSVTGCCGWNKHNSDVACSKSACRETQRHNRDEDPATVSFHPQPQRQDVLD